MNNIYFKIIIAGCLIAPTSIVMAQTNEIYRYKDASGKVVYTDKIPKAKLSDVGVLSKKTGIIKNLSEMEAFQNQDVNDEEKAEMALAKLQEAEQIKKDQYLLNTYSNPEEIEKIKLYELDQIDRAIQNDSSTLATIKERKATIEKELSVKGKVKDRQAAEAELSRLTETHDRTISSLDKNKRMYLEREQKYNGEKERFKAVIELINKEKEAKKTR